jgi:iduronate 2-sulfatase
MKRISCCFACGVVLLLGSLSARAPEPPTAKMNVLFIFVDDLRPTLGCYGDSIAITPNIDKLAGEGVLFSRAYCQQAVCNPSRASILTGLRPDQDGVTDLATHFREKIPDVVTLPQLFKSNGYLSIDVGKIFHDARFAQDSASWSVPPIYNYNAKADQYFLPEHKHGGKATASEFADVPDDYYTDGKIADASIAWLRRLKASGQPFFLAVGFKKPHLPFCAPKKYWDLYSTSEFTSRLNDKKPVNAPSLAFHHWQELRGYTDIPDSGSLTLEKEASLRHGYYACVSFVDAQLGRVIRELEALHLSRNTLIVFCGDNGFHLGEQDLWCKSTNFELDDRVPFMMSVPGVSKANVRTDAMVELVDIYPTVVDLCGVKPAGPLSGISLRPLLQNPSMKWDKVAFSQFVRPYQALFSKFSVKAREMGYSVRTKDWRFTAWYDLKGDTVAYKELYHMTGNDIERVNLADDDRYRSVQTRLMSLIRAYKDKAYDRLNSL